jgi:pimeloyl-ACP methyl ester carboxylesterase
MATFACIHGGGDVGWSWHLVEAALRARGHRTVAPDLPSDDDTADLDAYAASVVDAVGALGEREELGPLVVVGHSYGGFTAPLVADRLAADVLVLVTAMIPAPGESPGDWWSNTGYAVETSDDPFETYFNGVPRALAEEAQTHERGESEAAYAQPWPLAAWPDVPTRFVLCTEDRFLPPEFMRPLVAERLGITPDEIPACHCAALSHPEELAALLDGYVQPGS